MKVRSGILTQPRYDHDCERCVLIALHHGAHGIEDVYLCLPIRGGMGDLVHRRSSEPSDYTSTPFTIEGEPDPERKRMYFDQIRTVERALSTMQMICRAYEQAIEDGDEEKRASIIQLLEQTTWFGAMHLQDGTLTEEKIRLSSSFFDTDIGNRWPVIYTPHEYTPAPEER